MAYFFDQLDFLIGGRLTAMSYTPTGMRPGESDADVVLVGQFVHLAPGQHVDVEEDFLQSHLPFRRACFGGLDAGDEPWLFVIQAAPRQLIQDRLGAEADPGNVMTDCMAAALEFNLEARTGVTLKWTRGDLLGIYEDRGAGDPSIRAWPTLDLLRGLLAELTGVELTDLVAGHPGCAFPDQPHICEHDVFNDAFTAWTMRLGSG